MKRIFFISSIIIFILVLAFVLVMKLIIIPQAQKTETNIITTNEDIKVISPLANSVVSSPLTIKGMVMGNGWSGFEGQVGTVKLLYGSAENLENAKELASGILTATTEWTALPTSFETTLNFKSPGEGTGYLVFKNENPSGEAERDKTFIVVVRFK